MNRSEQIGEMLAELAKLKSMRRRHIAAGHCLHRSGDIFDSIGVVADGIVKINCLASDGREQLVGLKLLGDWLGLDGIATGVHRSDAICIDRCEVLTVDYAELISHCQRDRSLLLSLHTAMSRELTTDRELLMSVCTLPADARVASFLRNFNQSLVERGLQTGQFTLKLTRAEIGNYLGLTLETVSRALSKLVRLGLIEFDQLCRREIRIPRAEALSEFVGVHQR